MDFERAKKIAHNFSGTEYARPPFDGGIIWWVVGSLGVRLGGQRAAGGGSLELEPGGSEARGCEGR